MSMHHHCRCPCIIIDVRRSLEAATYAAGVLHAVTFVRVIVKELAGRLAVVDGPRRCLFAAWETHAVLAIVVICTCACTTKSPRQICSENERTVRRQRKRSPMHLPMSLPVAWHGRRAVDATTRRRASMYTCVALFMVRAMRGLVDLLFLLLSLLAGSVSS
jgi:hypothetical protein